MVIYIRVTRSRPADALGLHRTLLQSFPDPSHLAIFDVLLEVPCIVREFFEEAGLNQPNRSSHLSCLRECDLVVSSQQGNYVGNQLCDVGVAALIGVGR